MGDACALHGTSSRTGLQGCAEGVQTLHVCLRTPQQPVRLVQALLAASEPESSVCHT